MNHIIRQKRRMQVGIVALAIIFCSLLFVAATFNIDSIKATCKPSTERSRNSAEVSQRDIVEKPQPRTNDESTCVAVEEASSEPELSGRSGSEESSAGGSCCGSDPLLCRGPDGLR